MSNIKETEVVKLSPQYTLTIEIYDQGDEYWETSRGVVTDASGEVLFDIRRNHYNFWHTFVHHPNGNDYLLCGENYQGYNVVNLTTRVNHAYICDGADTGFGFCWVEAEPSPNRSLLRVTGCIWGFPYQTLVFDFSDPDQPLREVYDDKAEYHGYKPVWTSDTELTFTEDEVQKSPVKKTVSVRVK